jgi:UDP-N-acetylmuramoyl-tripeptide--D-alanyl-D-alanine ligase
MVTLDDEGLPTATLVFADGLELGCTLEVPGRHVVSDLLLAMAIVWRLGVDREAAAQAIARMPRTGMRLEVKTAPGRPRVIDDSYNASPNSMAGALDVLASMACTGRRVAVLGEIGELGDQSPLLHGLVGAYAAAKGLDLVAFVGGEAARQMADAARTMGFSDDRLELFGSCDQALATLAPVLAEDDLVLVKASRFMGLDAFAKGVLA